LNIHKKRYDHFRFFSHNINGLRGDNSKINKLEKWAGDTGYDFFGISETNLNKREGCNMRRNNSAPYQYFWSSKDNKVKGSGVALAFSKDLA
jgi:exonuclease III